VRLPGWAYRRLERVYMDQRAIRRREQREAVEREDQALRAWAARAHEAHDSGMCGGAAAGCRFFPCYSVRP
jgi:hypothetical protein